MIFTSPSSAKGDLDAEAVPEPQGRRKKTPSKRPPVATQLKMDGQVTARAIAYAAVQVRCPLGCCSSPSIAYTLTKLHFSLCDATHWMSHYNGFNYEEFYEFIIDFFEADQTPEGKTASVELRSWWNRYVPETFHPVLTNTCQDEYSRGLRLPERHHLSRRGYHPLRSYKNNAEPVRPAWPRSIFSSSEYVYLVDPNIIVRRLSDTMCEPRDFRSPNLLHASTDPMEVENSV